MKSTEEINLIIEDMGLNLQSMMASPFVKPFLEKVRLWDEKLSIISNNNLNDFNCFI